MYLKILTSYLAITFLTAWFNYHIVLTQDIGDTQIWHISQLLQWVVVYASIAWLTNEYLILVGYAFIYPFLYDGLLNTFLNKEWFYAGAQEYGASYTLDYKLKIVFLAIGIFIIYAKYYFNANNQVKK